MIEMKYETEDELLAAARKAREPGAHHVPARLLLFAQLVDHLESCIAQRGTARPAMKKLAEAVRDFRDLLYQLQGATEEKPYGEAIHGLLVERMRAVREALDEVEAQALKEIAPCVPTSSSAS